MIQYGKVDVFFQVEDFQGKRMWIGRISILLVHLGDQSFFGRKIIWRFFNFKGPGYVGLKAVNKGVCFNFINIHAPCNFVQRREVWRGLLRKKNVSVGEERGIEGDFNTILTKEEGIGKSIRMNGRYSEYFNNFVEEMELIDLPCMGGRFTWFICNGLAMSRMDIFLLTDKFIRDWKLVSQFVGKKVLSEHYPVWLKGGGCDWGTKPVRFNNDWYKHEDFTSFVNKE